MPDEAVVHPSCDAAEVKLGELFKQMDKAQGARTDKEPSSTDGTKFETIRNLGFDDPKKAAHRFETLVVA